MSPTKKAKPAEVVTTDAAATPVHDAATEVNDLVQRGLKALAAYASFTQEQIDHIVKKASVAALHEHGNLAKLAVEETGRGIFEDKATKNIFACEHVTHSMAKMKTVGVIGRDDLRGIVEIAEPVGVIAGVTPVTNPTSTAIFKALMAIKTRNPIIFGFHPSAQQCSIAAAKIVRDAAIEAGAPEDCVQWIEHPSIQATSELMNHPGVSLVLATGGNAMVRAAYSTGKPALGVGAGNVPAYVAKDAKLGRAINDIVLSKGFDNGVVCASEQAAILDTEIYDEALEEFRRLHAYVVTPEEKTKLEEYFFGVTANSVNCAGAKLNAAVVGKSAVWLAEQAGFTVPADTSILLAEISGVGPHEPLSREKLSPLLAVLRANSTEEGIRLSEQMVEFDGLGHSGAIHTEDKALSEEFGRRVKAVRILWNQPSALGGIGDIYNALIPSLTLGCGSYGANSVSNNVSAVNLINVKRVARRNNNMQWFKVPPKTYFEPNSIQYLADMRDVERVTIVTDRVMASPEIGIVDKVLDVLHRRDNPVAVQIIDTVEPEPSVETVEKGAQLMRDHRPDTIIAIGGGSPMDASKVMWLKYEHPELDFADLREKFFDVRKRAFQYPTLGKLAQLVCIPTSSGTGAEVTPFAVISDHKTGYKYPLADYALTPSVAIIDPVLTASMPAKLAVDSGMDALTHATEAFVSVYANDFTDGLALHAIKLVFENIEKSALTGDTEAREKMHNAATIAGMAFGNAFLGIVHAMSHTVGATHKLIHGRTNAMFLPYAIRYNGLVPGKVTGWPKAEKYIAPERFQVIAKHLGLPASTPQEAVESYANACRDLATRIGVEASFQAQGVSEQEYIGGLDALAMRAYEDQCAPANPRLPMLQDMKDIMVAAYYGITQDEVRAQRLDGVAYLDMNPARVTA
ncbi:iron-containing alcohol dehydrogenase [Xylanimonas cellulosilytica DSM 15894]|uniref:Aldehyde-alcohol dehydrogenase n=1 Tax=Xylanimonas cellulosilytica (strain DSM 15894 / JCM 12276 / CECT 5975 / KCTC 9989 / LMG 20990 / NBRC 107835 / XIL07) TaxID=446471 RepID=D1BVV1_XYLCX|nr:bifunctional acetaldehyde-CoA/alcohol dehydrogenase [Xylanimonas cellulosilytica]ACZ31420.1 iron-containing alcohol dehydrogenase [Xylanimonas cellulosilytica DSM 15894]